MSNDMREALRAIGKRFESMNGVLVRPVSAALITADEFAAIRNALAAPAPVAQPLTRELVREVTADAQEVFQAGSSDTLQVVRDVIEYFSASLKARIDQAEATGQEGGAA